MNSGNFLSEFVKTICEGYLNETGIPAKSLESRFYQSLSSFIRTAVLPLDCVWQLYNSAQTQLTMQWQ